MAAHKKKLKKVPGGRAGARQPRRRPKRTAAELGALVEPGAFLVLRTDAGEVARIPDDERLQRAAMAWGYKVRNRIRWNASERGRKAQARQCRELLEELGLDTARLQAVSDRGIVEVAMPYRAEEVGWASRILPWEYVLSAATRELRSRPLTIVRHLQRPASRPRGRAARGPVGVVVSDPRRIAELYDFTSEEELAPRSLGRKSIQVRGPTLEALRRAAAEHEFDVVHVGGVDNHQGAELLDWPGAEEVRDGLVLAGEAGGEVPVEAHELARALNAGERRPRLVVFNLYHSAARIAALAVAEGAEVALGFQDTFDDLAAELFIGDFYQAWARTEGDALVAFQTGWESLRDFPRPLAGTGIVLWSARSLVRDADAVRDAARTHAAAFAEARQELLSLASSEEARDALRIDCEPMPQLNYALLHNRRPLFQSFELRKNLVRPGRIADVQVEVELAAGSAPLLYRSNETVGDAGAAMTEKVFLPLTSELARTLEESLDTSLRILVSVGGSRVYERPHRITLLPINEWVDDDLNRQYLPSFVWPLDPAVRRVVGSAQPHLHTLADDPGAGFDGYQCVDWEDEECEDPTAGVDHQVAALWRGLLDRELGYINPPPTYNTLSQRLRTPSRILDEGRGTCIDLALLLCACLEYVDIYPVVFLLQGHAFPGYWRSEEEWEDFVRLRDGAAQDGAQEEELRGRLPSDLGDAEWMFPGSPKPAVRKLVYKLVRQQVEEGHLVPLESVWLTSRRSFREAQDDGWDNLLDPGEFHSLVDIKSARLASPPVTPLPLVAAPR